MIENPKQKRALVALFIFIVLFLISGVTFVFTHGLTAAVACVVTLIAGVCVMGHADDFVGASTMRENDGIEEDE